LFANNFGPQLQQGFHEACREMNTIVYLLPDNHTVKVQPVDAGFGKAMKQKIGEAMQIWLEKEENLEMWQENPDDPVDRPCMERVFCPTRIHPKTV